MSGPLGGIFFDSHCILAGVYDDCLGRAVLFWMTRSLDYFFVFLSMCSFYCIAFVLFPLHALYLF